MSQYLRDPKPEQIEAARKRSPQCAALWDERYDPPLDLDRLATLPDGTLGREYARFVRDNDIEPLGSLVAWGAPKNLLHIALRRTHEFAEAIRLSGDWARIGERTPPYAGFRLEDMMDRRVEEVRQHLLAAA
jgi:ubiquinone biosynthesis protein Coq4